MDAALRETSKYSIAFVKAENKCGTAVQFYDTDTTLCFGGVCTNRFLERVEIVNPGSGYNELIPPSVNISGGVVGATATLKIEDGRIVDVIVTNPGSGTNTNPITITVTGGSGNGAVLRGVCGGSILKQANTVKLQYTNEKYEVIPPPTNPNNPKLPPYPNIGGAVPYEDDYIMGENYVKIVGDGNGEEGQLGAGKRLEDLPLCIATPLRVDVIPSLERMSYYESNEKSLKSIVIIDGGSGYSENMLITISEPDAVDENDEPLETNRTAIVSAVIDEEGRIIEIIIVDSGNGYRTPPTITITDPGPDEPEPDEEGETEEEEEEEEETGEPEPEIEKRDAILAPSLYLKPNSKSFNAYIFGGDNPTQEIIWESHFGLMIPTPQLPVNGVTLADIGVFRPHKTVRDLSGSVVGKMISDGAVAGSAVVWFVPQIMTDWSDPETPLERGYTAGKDIRINTWVFGGGIRQDLVVTIASTTTDPNTNFNIGTSILRVGNNERADYITLNVSYRDPDPFEPPLLPIELDIYRKYITITTDRAGYDTANNVRCDLIPHCYEKNKPQCLGGPSCYGETIQFFARLRIDDTTEFAEINYTNQDITDVATWTISGNILPETTITNGLLRLGYVDTVYQEQNILQEEEIFYIPGPGRVTNIKLYVGGNNYELNTTGTITNSNGDQVGFNLEVIGRIESITYEGDLQIENPQVRIVGTGIGATATAVAIITEVDDDVFTYEYEITVTNGGLGYDGTTVITIYEGSEEDTCDWVGRGRIESITSINGNTIGGFTPNDEIELSSDGTGFRCEIVIDNHLGVNNTPTVFIRRCERGNISVAASFNDVRENTVP